MTLRKSGIFRLCYSLALAVATLFGVGEYARPQDWPQWRGPLGQGTTTAKNLPPMAGSTSLKVHWKTPIPGEGCSSPVVSQGRVYLTTAYEGTQRHAWDRPAFWASVILACSVAGLALTQIPRIWRSWSPRPVLMSVLGVWTMAVVVLTALVLAKPPWFWQFADPWTGTTVVTAELPWVESLNLRPVIVLLCGSLVLIFTGGAGQKSEVRDQRSEVRDQRSEVRDQKSEVRDQKSEIRSQKSEIRSQKSEIRRPL